MNASIPKINKILNTVKIHNEELIDNYSWIKQKDWKEVILNPNKLNAQVKKYLDEENLFKENQLKDIKDIEKKLFEELKSKIKNEDNSVPKKDGDYFYGYKYNKNSEYPIYYRKNIIKNSEEIILDCEKKSKTHTYFNVASISHSHNHKSVAYNIDTNGSEYFSIFVEDIDKKEILSPEIKNTTGDIIWSLDNNYIFYVGLDQNHRPTKVFKHKIGSDTNKDLLIYEEKDPSFFCSINLSKTKKYLFIRTADHETSEYLFINLQLNETTPVLFKKRIKKIEYDLEHHEKFFLISTNTDEAKNFKIMISHEQSYQKWEEFIAYEKDNLILDFILLKDWLVRLERTEGSENIIILNLNNKDQHKISFDEEAYNLSLDHGYEYETDTFRYSYSSPTTPKSIFDYDCKLKKQELKKTQEVPSGHNKDDYICKKIFATAHDNEKIPITILYKKGVKLDSNNYLLLYGYGSYGISIPSNFSTNRLSLVDRGIIYAIAHIRGGKEKGYEWYENGKLLNKKNTFLDFISCAKKLCEDKYTSPKKIIAQGGSAGGLLMGYIANESPDLFLGIIAQVPFVDICNTMLDEDLPLTVTEIPEWGDIKNDKKSFLYVKSYSPYDNVKKQNYPHMLVTGGISDPRVTYWEMTKWVAKLRENKTDNNLLLLHMNMTAGHSGASGRFDYLKEIAMEYGFVLKICKMLS
ncbi:MAG: S9 family peptidase [Candidatus Fonsibacter sp.]|jgi:oligopeptidase B|nr:S9 family peptidase [Candidatus Fonsibacter sp.]